MDKTQEFYTAIINLLTIHGGDYKLFEHREALTYEELALIQQEVGFFGTEMKCMVFNADENILVYVTLQGKRSNMSAIKAHLQCTTLKLATPEELWEHVAAKPGCAYPFGFESTIPIYIDPSIFQEDWLLFSPVLPTRTVQIRGTQLQEIYNHVPNRVELAAAFTEQ